MPPDLHLNGSKNLFLESLRSYALTRTISRLIYCSLDRIYSPKSFPPVFLPVRLLKGEWVNCLRLLFSPASDLFLPQRSGGLKMLSCLVVVVMLWLQSSNYLNFPLSNCVMYKYLYFGSVTISGKTKSDSLREITSN